MIRGVILAACLASMANAASAQGIAPRLSLDTTGPCRVLAVQDPVTAVAIPTGCIRDGKFVADPFGPGNVYPAQSGGSSATGTGNKFLYAGIQVRDDRVAQVPNASGTIGSKVDAFGVIDYFGGGSTQGGRHAVEGVLVQTAPTDARNVDRNYVGVQGQSVSGLGDGGTRDAPRGAYAGSSGIAIASAGAGYLLNITGYESNAVVEHGATVAFVSGLQIADSLASRGYQHDAALSISNLGGSPLTHRNAILIGAQNGAPAIGADGYVINMADGSIPTAAAFLFAPNTTFADGVIQTADTTLSGAGLRLLRPGASLEIGSLTTAGSSYFDMHGSGRDNDFDVRLGVIGGTASTGQGRLYAVADAFSTPTLLPATPTSTVGGEQSPFLAGFFKQVATGALSVAGATPASATAPGATGTITWDANYIYVCVAPNSWKRTPLAAW